MPYQDRTYHGVQTYELSRIEAEMPATGPTERESVTVLYELFPTNGDGGGFGWGYNGGGTSRAASAILADALDLGDQDAAGISLSAYPEDRVLVDLREDFCDDVLSQFCDEWRLRRGVVLRWARAWYLQRGIDEIPPALQYLPPLFSLD
ncbi:DUF6166 domain-containing protein [Kribbella sp. NPDC059898]|uniref:DUF6166 domain-containing protein n=1 Tax=Kribbella sp. NPDC059898 TaxID=3346995 RepID=UPI0036570793